MFVMAVIQAIAETNADDQCMFLFEEPESFLHENHQEYFYKMVLCQLASRGHQVIYTTHSDKMIDIFDTKSIIRIEFDEHEKRTRLKYNKISDFIPSTDNVISLSNYNSFIKSVEPNLNKILFSRKVLLVEGPNDLLSYNFAIEDVILKKIKNKQFARAYMNFKNFAVIPHHGKSTVFILVELCKHFGIDYFLVNDWDFENDFRNFLIGIHTLEELHSSDFYLQDNGSQRSPTSKGMITTNWKILKNSLPQQMHFNMPRLETVLGYNSNDKDSLGIWSRLNELNSFSESFFPPHLIGFLEIDRIEDVPAIVT